MADYIPDRKTSRQRLKVKDVDARNRAIASGITFLSFAIFSY